MASPEPLPKEDKRKEEGESGVDGKDGGEPPKFDGKVNFPDAFIIKYGRHGKPHRRVLFLNMSGPNPSFGWCKSSRIKLKRASNAPIYVRDIIDIRKGKETKVFRRPIAERIDESKCLSVVTPYRTLDLEVRTEQERDALAAIITDVFRKVTRRDLLSGIRVRRESTMLRRAEFYDQVEQVMNSLHEKVREIWEKGLKDTPAHMIDKDFPRLAKNFKIHYVGPPESIPSSPDKKVRPSLMAALDQRRLTPEAPSGGVIAPGPAVSPRKHGRVSHSVKRPRVSEDKKDLVKEPSSKEPRDIVGGGGGGGGDGESHSKSDVLEPISDDESSDDDIDGEGAASPDKDHSGKLDNRERDVTISINPEPKTPQQFVKKRLDSCDYAGTAVHNVGEVMRCLTERLLTKEKGDALQKLFVTMIEKSEEENRDIQNILREFFNKEFQGCCDKPLNGKDNMRAFLALLKVCNQNIIFPPVYILKQIVLDPWRARDVHEKGGWDISIQFLPDRTYLTHSRREVSDAGKFSYQWTLTLTFSAPAYDLVDSALQVTELKFRDDAIDYVRHDMSTRLFTVNRIGATLQKKKQPHLEKNGIRESVISGKDPKEKDHHPPRKSESSSHPLPSHSPFHSGR